MSCEEDNKTLGGENHIMRELIIETQRYDSSDVVFSMYLIIETKYICQK